MGLPASADISGQLSFVLSLLDMPHYQRMLPYCVPMFADASMTPQISTNSLAAQQWVEKIGAIGDILASGHAHSAGTIFAGPPAGAMPWLHNQQPVAPQHQAFHQQQVNQPGAHFAAQPQSSDLRFGI